jgi:ATP-dependent Clp protease adaptor protein ClpS
MFGCYDLFEACLASNDCGMVEGSRLRCRSGTKLRDEEVMRALMMAKGNGRGGDDEDGDGRSGVATKVKPKTKKPSLYKVLILNDDFTPMEFVVFVLEQFFAKTRDEATRIMLHVHHKGVGICGVYTYEVAESKVMQVMDFARQNQHPLQCTMEKE